MSIHRLWVIAFLCALVELPILANGETFTTFPEQTELSSADRRYVLRSVDAVHRPSDFSGMFHSLVVEDRATGQSRRLYDYLHKVAVAWSGDHFIGTDYVSKKSSRVLVLSPDPSADAYIVDRNDLAGRIPAALRACLQDNDHVFVEAVRMNGDTLALRVWGYGVHNRGGFRLSCDLSLQQGSVSCQENSRASSQP